MSPSYSSPFFPAPRADSSIFASLSLSSSSESSSDPSSSQSSSYSESIPFLPSSSDESSLPNPCSEEAKGVNSSCVLNLPGVTCGQVDGVERITELSLPNNNMRGHLHTSIGNMDKIIYLDLSNNNLDGTLPPQMEDMTLKYIDLSSNQFTSTVYSIRNLGGTNFIDLSSNYFYGPTGPFLDFKSQCDISETCL
ncbi:hypothetical protein Pelo_19255 [Pelomyxa schiedti]|nr:hypothetical protein Pelo_19255 [Pelomyxa schiedti]